MLASQELGILDSLGHISVRNPRNPNHYFISRAVSAGMVTAQDIIENDLDSKPVAGARNDQFQEVYMHGEIYKARPDVVAIVHAHTPEFVAFGQSSVKLRSVSNGGTFIGDGLPEFVIGKFLNPQEPRVGCAPPCITTPALGQAVATVMGRKPGVLLTGHGIALTDASFYDLVSRVHLLRVNAQIQQMAILLGGQINYLEFPDTPPGPAAPPAAGEFRPPQVDPNLPEGTGGGTFGAPRAWEYWRQITPVD
jgi:HCOMODA/2-hydroxy-3-carboxy-muconic semialdehyde decarboxylase